MTQSKLIVLAVAVTIIAAMAFQNLVATRRLAKAQGVVADLSLKLEVSEQTKLAEREAYQQAMNLVASVRESEQRLISLSNSINAGVANLGIGQNTAHIINDDGDNIILNAELFHTENQLALGKTPCIC